MSSKGDYNPEGTGGVYNLSVVIAVINLALVGLVFLVDIMLLSSGVILFFLLGFYAVYLAIKDGDQDTGYYWILMIKDNNVIMMLPVDAFTHKKKMQL